MDVVSASALRLGSLLWQPRRGSYTLTVVAKATFRLAPGEAVFADEQEYPSEIDKYYSGDLARCIYSPSDLVPRKRRADVLLVGHAYAPDGAPVRSLLAWLVAGKVDKEIEVFGDRALKPDGRIAEGPGFAKMSLAYERAAGGPDTANPVGVRTGEGARADTYGFVPLPNLERPGRTSIGRSVVIDPIGFGPVSPTWPARRRLLGAHEGVVAGTALKDAPLPEDFDFSYFNAAPQDQQADTISETERIVLQNLHPELPRLVMTLPGLHPRAFVLREGAAPKDLAMKCDTLWIDTDRAICTLTWRGQVALEARHEPGRVLIGMEKAGQRVELAQLEALAEEVEDVPIEDATSSIDPTSTVVPALPGWSAPPSLSSPVPRSTSRLPVFVPDPALPFHASSDPGASGERLAAFHAEPTQDLEPRAPVRPRAPRNRITEMSLDHAAAQTGATPAWLASRPAPASPPPSPQTGPVLPPPLVQLNAVAPPPLMGPIPVAAPSPPPVPVAPVFGAWPPLASPAPEPELEQGAPLVIPGSPATARTQTQVLAPPPEVPAARPSEARARTTHPPPPPQSGADRAR
jgi:hypothetical protein